MNIDELTIGEAKKLAAMFGGNQTFPDKEHSTILNEAIGKYVIIRSRNEGINAGLLVRADETGCVLSDARRIWYHKPKDSKTAWYEGVANSGLDSSSKISCPVEQKYIIESYSVTICSKKAANSIKGCKSHES